MILEFGLLIVGLILLIKGSDVFVSSASSLARMLGVSEFVIGLSLVSLGTSIPELAGAIAAGLQGSTELIIGNVIGSNIANIALVIGVGAMIAIIRTKKEMLRRDGYIMLFATALFFIFSLNGVIGRIESLLFLMIYIGYIFFLFEDKKHLKGNSYLKEFLYYMVTFRFFSFYLNKKKAKVTKKDKDYTTKNILVSSSLLVAGLIGIIVGAKIMIDNAISIAVVLGISETIIGFSVIAIGTSIPELIVIIVAAIKRHGDIALGNVIGSNIANILLVSGTSGALFGLFVSLQALWLMMPFLIFLSVLLLLYIRTGWEITRWEGFTLFLLYISFMIYLFL